MKPSLIIRLHTGSFLGELDTPNELHSYSPVTRDIAIRFQTVTRCMSAIEQHKLEGTMIETVQDWN